MFSLPRSNEPSVEPTAKVLSYESELDFMARCVADFPKLETGGDLFGFWTHTGQPVIQYVLGPGADVRRTETAFYQDASYLDASGVALRRRHGLQHIGEWHSHHQLALPTPSGGDVRTVRRAMREYGLQRFVLVIGALERLTRRGRRLRPTLRGYLFTAEQARGYHAGAWVVQPGASPFRTGDELSPEATPYEPRTWQTEWSSEPRVSLDERLGAARPRRAVFDAGSWLATPEGRDLLSRVLARVDAMAERRKLTKDREGRLVLGFNCDGVDFVVTFPDRFPYEQPAVQWRTGAHEVWREPRVLVGPASPSTVEEAGLAFLERDVLATVAWAHRARGQSMAVHAEDAPTPHEGRSADGVEGPGKARRAAERYREVQETAATAGDDGLDEEKSELAVAQAPVSALPHQTPTDTRDEGGADDALDS